MIGRASYYTINVVSSCYQITVKKEGGNMLFFKVTASIFCLVIIQAALEHIE